MNTQLINSIVQVVQSLSKEEQQTLITQLNTLAETSESTDELTQLEQQDAWDVFLSLGEEASPGKLENPSVNHDRYLYQQPE
ncbi:MAG: hypothetical protein GVY17_09905 [Cyanobacteria bacterium]|jgi:hypothetical protein|nr:hypothetical protein [Cyanobacteria bacterium GSL.Bin21]